jgi:hypothetical protein
MTQPAQEPAEAPGAAPAPARPVRVLALVAAALGVVSYLLGFVGNAGTIDLARLLVIGGGLLAAGAVLPRAGRALLPAAVMAGVGPPRVRSPDTHRSRGGHRFSSGSPQAPVRHRPTRP